MSTTTLEDHVELARRCWNAYGRQDPFYSVITAPQFKGLTWNDRTAIEAFYSTGHAAMVDFQGLLEPHRIRLGGKVALDFGCGVGRLSFALAPYFERVEGIDISKFHLAQARIRRDMLPGAKNVLFGEGLTDVPPHYDFACSVIVLQHLTPPLQADYILQILRQLNRGGSAILHVMTSRLGYAFDEAAALRQADRMQMHVLTHERMVQVVCQAGCEILGCEKDPAEHGPGYVHHYYVIRRPS